MLIGGLFYSQDLVKDHDAYAATDLFKLLGLANFQTIGDQYRQRTESEAAYLHSEWTFAPSWTLVSGVRYTNDKKFDQATTFLIQTGWRRRIPPTTTYGAQNSPERSASTTRSAAQHSLIYGNISRGIPGPAELDPDALKPFQGRDRCHVWSYASVEQYDAVERGGLRLQYHDAQYSVNSPVGVLLGVRECRNARVRDSRPMPGGARLPDSTCASALARCTRASSNPSSTA